MFKYTVSKKENQTVFKLEGDLDIEATEVIEEKMTEDLSEGNTDVVFDFQNIDFVDSSGIGLLITLVTDLKENNRNPVIIHVQEDVKFVFDLLELDKILGSDVLAFNS
ncbi:STAS domain-containing protein [Bacillus massiliglaciei]|uniref:STAS domain-containing protein n=1 Tax=Bacillus massiliglaciei TaxID=1816693 RepID=UPI000A7BC00D|nr:STAS domain-containing protein [Bacillus massiliglaciei]